LCTALVPAIGYDKAAQIAKVASDTNRTVREVAEEIANLKPDVLDALLDPRKQLEPS